MQEPRDITRYVYKKVVGKPWPKWAAIHHIDGDPLNNEPENLRVVDIRENHRRTERK